MTTPKPGDVLTTEQARTLPDGAVVSMTWERTLTDAIMRSAIESWAEHDGITVTLVSLPTPPDMAPGSVVLDEDGAAWLRCARSNVWWSEVDARYRNWSGLAPRVARVLHDAGGA